MDRKLVITLSIEFLVGLVVTIGVSLWIKELPWAEVYPISLSAIPLFVAIFIMLVTFVISTIGTLIRNRGNKFKTANIFAFCVGIIALFWFLSVL